MFLFFLFRGHFPRVTTKWKFLDIFEKNKGNFRKNFQEISEKIGENNINEILDTFWILFLSTELFWIKFLLN